jgi:hypothetical protein
MIKAFLSVAPPLSFTCTVKFEVPAAEGGPLITPPALRVRPCGSAPPLRDHWNGCVPPVAASGWLYAEPTLPCGSVVVVMFNAAATVTESTCVSLALLASVTPTVNMALPAIKGVPDRSPPCERCSPAGGKPDETDHLYGCLPPVA